MPTNTLYFWKQMPFLRLIIPLMVGIMIQFYIGLSLNVLLVSIAVVVALILITVNLPLAKRYLFRSMQGMLINVFILLLGCLLLYNKDIRNNKQWIGRIYEDSLAVLITLREPLVEKAKSYKAETSIEAIRINNEWVTAKGNLLIYLSKDSTKPNLEYGSQIVLNKPLQEIKNSGNPGNFNYKQYNAFKDIYHQVFLKGTEYINTGVINKNDFQEWLYTVRSYVIRTLEKYIYDEREEGVAEALLIGYRDNLDKDLVQAYSNTGVVHIIAISGLHLGMIYGGLVWIFGLFRKFKWNSWIRPIVILLVLWIFTFLAGAAPSILRSAVMFSFIVLGELISKKSSIYNTLASSAFVMLLWNPYYIWDIGFQLSYIAVISIVIFSKPIYNWMYVENKALNFFWRITSVTLAAQILTMPIIFYSFHQFPNLFLFTNILIVPWSSLILYAELAIVIFSPLSIIAEVFGIVVSAMLKWMNFFIESMSSLDYALYDEIQNNLWQTWLLYIAIAAFGIWLMRKNKPALITGLTAIVLFIIIDSVDAYKVRNQSKLIVYNVPKQTAIDFIAGGKYSFIGDSVLMEDGYLRNFHLKPARTLYKVSKADVLPNLYVSLPFIQYQDKRLLIIDKPYKFQNRDKISIDIIILSKNPKVYISELANVFNCKQFVFDGSNSIYRMNKWKKDCDSLHLQHHLTVDKGAYELSW